MKNYKLWIRNGEVIEMNLNDEPQKGDVIEYGDVELKVEGRRFVDGVLHYPVVTSGYYNLSNV